MPLDNSHLEFLSEVEVFDLRPLPKAKPDLTVATLATLAYILRHKEHWPTDFKWNFASWDACACGLAYELWPTATRAAGIFGWLDRQGLPYESARVMFGHPVTWWTTPEIIAERIETFLAAERGA